MSREERLRLHEERVRRIIEERKKEREAAEARREEQQTGEGAGEEAAEEPQQTQDTVRIGTVILYVAFENKDSGEQELDTIVREGDRFLSEVRLQNELAVPFDRVRIALSYDKRFLKPVRVFDDQIRSATDREPHFTIDPRESVLIYDAKLARPRLGKEVPILRVVWEAIRPTDFTDLRFEFASDDDLEDIENARYHTAIYREGRNVLGESSDEIDGVLSGSLLILKPFDPSKINDEQILQGKKEELRDIYLATVGSEDYYVGMKVLGPERTPAVGEEFEVDIALANPQGAIVDSVRFFLHFDPEVLEVIDEDRGNWIKTGVNVHDGPFRDEFPFDYHKRNEVDNQRGLINYGMAISRALTLPSETFARVKFRAKKPVESTQVELIASRPGTGPLTTVKMFGYELMTFHPALTKPVYETTILAEPLEVETVQEDSPQEREMPNIPGLFLGY